MRTLIATIIVSVLVFSTLTQTQTGSAQNFRSQKRDSQHARTGLGHELGIKPGEKDFLLPGEGFENWQATAVKSATAQSLNAPVVSTSFPVESVVQYKSFTFGTTFSLHAFSGKYVSYLMSDSLIGPGGLSKDEIRELVDLTDVLYAHMVEVVGGEPDGDGPLTIALLNPGYDFGGRGWIGKKGVELHQSYAINYKKDLLAGCVPNPMVHEMAHNFDLYNAYISHDGNNYHAWTAFLIPYIQYYTQAGSAQQGRVVAPATLLDQTIINQTSQWDAAGTNASWPDCVKNGTGCEVKEIYANFAWAGLLLRFARLHKPSAVRRAFSFLKAYKTSHPSPPATAEAKNDVLVSALAEGAQLNVVCEMDTWHWDVSSQLRDQMEEGFAGFNSFCNDADKDNYSPAGGDRDDFNTSINPVAIETTNGIDDDSNGIVDDILRQDTSDYPSDASTAAVVFIPSHVVGHTATQDDTDTYRIDISTPRSINIWAKGIGRWFSGWIELRFTNDPESTPPIYLSDDYPGGTVVTFDRVGSWTLTVVPWFGAGEGYELFFSEMEPALAPRLRVEAAGKRDSLLATVTLDQNAPREALPGAVRLWAEGFGFIDSKSFVPVTTFKWKSPSATLDVRLRAQFLSAESPVSNGTSAMSASASERK